MQILLITLLYTPDGGPSAPLMSMLCENLVQLGHQVTVIAAIPHFPSGRVPEQFRKGWIQHDEINGVQIIRVRVPSVDRTKLSLRLWQFICFQIGAAWAALRVSCDVVLITNPALEVFLPFIVTVILRRKRAVFFVADVYPKIGIQLGIFRHRPVIAVVDAMERFCLSHSRAAWIFAESFRTEMHKLGVPDNKIAVIYSWVDLEKINILSRHNAFSKEYGLDNHFVILYAGNLGLSQGWNYILKAAQILNDEENILFVFVGDGASRQELVEQTHRMNLDNTRIIPFQPHARVSEVLATSDLSLVSLQPDVGSGSSIPSKTFNYMASGRPVLMVTDEGCDAWNLIQRAEGGICIPSGNPKQLAYAIRQRVKNPDQLVQMGQNGRAYIEAHHSPLQAARQVETLLQHAASFGETT